MARALTPQVGDFALYPDLTKAAFELRFDLSGQFSDFEHLVCAGL